MKTINTLKTFTDRVLDGELSMAEACGMFVALVSVVSTCLYVFVPQTFN